MCVLCCMKTVSHKGKNRSSVLSIAPVPERILSTLGVPWCPRALAVKDPALSLLWLSFNSWSRKFWMPWVELPHPHSSAKRTLSCLEVLVNHFFSVWSLSHSSLRRLTAPICSLVIYVPRAAGSSLSRLGILEKRCALMALFLLAQPRPWFLPVLCRLCSYCRPLFSRVHHRCGRRCPARRWHREGEEKSLWNNSMGSGRGCVLLLLERFVSSLCCERFAGRPAGKWWYIEERPARRHPPTFENWLWELHQSVTTSARLLHAACCHLRVFSMADCVWERRWELTSGLLASSRGMGPSYPTSSLPLSQTLSKFVLMEPGLVPALLRVFVTYLWARILIFISPML